MAVLGIKPEIDIINSNTADSILLDSCWSWLADALACHRKWLDLIIKYIQQLHFLLLGLSFAL
jgi:hypothetical protein